MRSRPHPAWLDDEVAEAETTLAEGRNLTEWGRAHGRSYAEISWLINDSPWAERMQVALRVGNNAAIEQICQQLVDIAQADPAELFTPDGHLRRMDDVPKPLRLAIDAVKVRTTGGDEPAEIVDVKLSSRIKAIELLGKRLRMFDQVLKVEAGDTLESLLKQSLHLTDDTGGP